MDLRLGPQLQVCVSGSGSRPQLQVCVCVVLGPDPSYSCVCVVLGPDPSYRCVCGSGSRPQLQVCVCEHGVLLPHRAEGFHCIAKLLLLLLNVLERKQQRSHSNSVV